MTTLAFKFGIDNIRQQTSVCGGAHIDISSLYATNAVATNIKFISFANGRGQIEYNDRLNVPELFTDPQPYQVYINQWLTSMSAIGLSQPLTLAQAQAIKCAYIAAVGTLKRSAPVNVTVGGIAYNWDASDLAMARMSTFAAATTRQLVAVGQTALVTLAAPDVTNIMTAIASQTSNAQAKSAQKQAEVNGFVNMSDVISYDVTTGW